MPYHIPTFHLPFLMVSNTIPYFLRLLAAKVPRVCSKTEHCVEGFNGHPILSPCDPKFDHIILKPERGEKGGSGFLIYLAVPKLVKELVYPKGGGKLHKLIVYSKCCHSVRANHPHLAQSCPFQFSITRGCLKSGPRCPR